MLVFSRLSSEFEVLRFIRESLVIASARCLGPRTSGPPASLSASHRRSVPRLASTSMRIDISVDAPDGLRLQQPACGLLPSVSCLPSSPCPCTSGPACGVFGRRRRYWPSEPVAQHTLLGLWRTLAPRDPHWKHALFQHIICTHLVFGQTRTK